MQITYPTESQAVFNKVGEYFQATVQSYNKTSKTGVLVGTSGIAVPVSFTEKPVVGNVVEFGADGIVVKTYESATVSVEDSTRKGCGNRFQ